MSKFEVLKRKMLFNEGDIEVDERVLSLAAEFFIHRTDKILSDSAEIISQKKLTTPGIKELLAITVTRVNHDTLLNDFFVMHETEIKSVIGE